MSPFVAAWLDQQVCRTEAAGQFGKMISMQSLRAFLCLAAVSPVFAALNEPIRVEQGLLSGIPGAKTEVRIFKGVPFAASPVGDLRWRAPKPAERWDGVRNADHFSATCVQRRPNNAAADQPPPNEDCLYLNIYTPAKSAADKLPVMVWIHGGSFTSGAGSIYDGEDLARQGVVVVTVNYRLGVFGFFAHPELTRESAHKASGNYGVLDQVAALQWVQKNIAAFGGDTKRVTIFGESAGSWSINFLVATPLARGLFQRAIGESGAQFAPIQKLAQAEQTGAKFATSVGANALAELRAKSADDLQKAGGFSGPDIDGWLLPDEVYTIFAKGKQNDVPLLIGSNADEGTMFAPATAVAESVREQARRRYGPNTTAFLKLYPFQTDTEARTVQAEVIRDELFGWEMRTWARMQNKTGKSKVYLYFFSRVPPGATSARMGSYHSAEIAYVFRHTNDSNRPWEDVDHKVSEAMSSYWVNFAATGDPNGKGLPKWPAYRVSSDQAMGFGDKIELIPLPHQPALDFFDGYFERVRSSPESEPQP